jgi:hypothetical protein
MQDLDPAGHYPRARLFRQTEPRGWEQVVGRVSAALQQNWPGDGTVVSPG